MEYWNPVPRELPCRDWDGLTVLAYVADSDRGVLATCSKAWVGPNAEWLLVNYGFTNYLGVMTPERIPMGEGPCTKVWAHFEWLLKSDDIHIVVVPPLRRHQPKRITPWTFTLAATFAVLAVLLFLLLPGPVAPASALPVGALVGGLILYVGSRSWRPTLASAGRLTLPTKDIVAYAKQRALGQRPELDRSAERRAELIAQIDTIKDAYAALLDDIVYRIENSAMFDSSVEITQRFEAALWRVNDDPLHTMNLAELEDAAVELEISWSVARDNAETIGLAHLPETVRVAAGRASRAARLALDTPSVGERRASMKQVVRLLDEMNVYYLPKVNPETLAIVAPARPPGAEQ